MIATFPHICYVYEEVRRTDEYGRIFSIASFSIKRIYEVSETNSTFVIKENYENYSIGFIRFLPSTFRNLSSF
jgi:hypothetical protein